MPCSPALRTATVWWLSPPGFKAGAAAAYNRGPCPCIAFPAVSVLAVPPRASAVGAIRICPPPSRLYLPLIESNGRALHSRVEPGQHVRRGEAVAHAADALATVLPAPTSGRIVAIEDRANRACQRPYRTDAGTGRRWRRRSRCCCNRCPAGPTRHRKLTLRRRLADAGIVGLGGAGYSKPRKSSRRPVDTLILNGAECEPYIGCDEALMRERAADVVSGAAVLAHITGATNVMIALEDRMQVAAAAIRAQQHRFAALRVDAGADRLPAGRRAPADRSPLRPRGAQRRVADGHRRGRTECRHRRGGLARGSAWRGA